MLQARVASQSNPDWPPRTPRETLAAAVAVPAPSAAELILPELVPSAQGGY
ncbi:hypothetical protein KTAU_01810 [Thermogemmatispora aurantia]|uniref:Uncharacterized protein n=1 Tax=Thermogemmatispora aurantia TaxID=2045279 RepID=A0A5J4K113_9CHLR|nr:hypothetical protein KTAU_01810 [Thermogemmatispora aurantia]